MTPRAELRDRLSRIVARHVPHLKVQDQLRYLAKRISAESGLSVGAGTVKDWLYAQDDDARRVDTRHSDWARSQDRSIAANDNRAWNPCRSEVRAFA